MLTRLQRRYGVAVDTHAAAHRLSRIDPQTGEPARAAQEAIGRAWPVWRCHHRDPPAGARRGLSSSRTRSPAASCPSSGSRRSRWACAMPWRKGPLGFPVVDVAVTLTRWLLPFGRQLRTRLPHRRAHGDERGAGPGRALSARAGQQGDGGYARRLGLEGRLGALQPPRADPRPVPASRLGALGAGRGAAARSGAARARRRTALAEPGAGELFCGVRSPCPSCRARRPTRWSRRRRGMAWMA